MQDRSGASDRTWAGPAADHPWDASADAPAPSSAPAAEAPPEASGSGAGTAAFVSFFDRAPPLPHLGEGVPGGFTSELRCLALNVYWEARSEPRISKIAVAQVTLNRVADPAFPDSICAVVRQGGGEDRHRCQFSWFCDGKKDEPEDAPAWQEAQDVAYLALLQWVPDPTGGAKWYHADYVKPNWSRDLLPMTRIGRHIYYVGNGTAEDRSRGLPLKLAQDLFQDVDHLVEMGGLGNQRRSDDTGVSGPLDQETRLE
jgi:spore germination cell wall hydrolase CwlJ-like protein